MIESGTKLSNCKVGDKFLASNGNKTYSEVEIVAACGDYVKVKSDEKILWLDKDYDISHFVVKLKEKANKQEKAKDALVRFVVNNKDAFGKCMIDGDLFTQLEAFIYQIPDRKNI